MKIRETVESHGHGDFDNRGLPLFKKFHSFFHAQVVQIFDDGHMHMFFKKTHEIVFTEIALDGQFFDRQCICIMKMDIVQYGFQLF